MPRLQQAIVSTNMQPYDVLYQKIAKHPRSDKPWLWQVFPFLVLADVDVSKLELETNAIQRCGLVIIIA